MHIDPTAKIHPTAVVEGSVGPRTTVSAHAYIGPLVYVGADCRIGPGAALGQDGFGYTQEDGRWTPKPQRCGVRIGDDVHVGANTCIDRGSYRDTTVARGTRIDNGVHVAHNVRIGTDCLVIAGAMLAGSVAVGNRAYIAPHACVREHTTIGADSFVALGAVVTRDVADGEHVKGVPAKTFQRRPTPDAPPAPERRVEA